MLVYNNNTKNKIENKFLVVPYSMVLYIIIKNIIIYMANLVLFDYLLNIRNSWFMDHQTTVSIT